MPTTTIIGYLAVKGQAFGLPANDDPEFIVEAMNFAIDLQLNGIDCFYYRDPNWGIITHSYQIWDQLVSDVTATALVDQFLDSVLAEGDDDQ